MIYSFNYITVKKMKNSSNTIIAFILIHSEPFWYILNYFEPFEVKIMNLDLLIVSYYSNTYCTIWKSNISTFSSYIYRTLDRTKKWWWKSTDRSKINHKNSFFFRRKNWSQNCVCVLSFWTELILKCTHTKIKRDLQETTSKGEKSKRERERVVKIDLIEDWNSNIQSENHFNPYIFFSFYFTFFKKWRKILEKY